MLNKVALNKKIKMRKSDNFRKSNVNNEAQSYV